ncbi:MAG: hypothetical protein AAFU03_14110, partial [Bacteroidota bacterium]
VDNDIVGEETCEACKVTNPYSFMAQVVVPAWPGRFDNIDFRTFFEKRDGRVDYRNCFCFCVLRWCY